MWICYMKYVVKWRDISMTRPSSTERFLKISNINFPTDFSKYVLFVVKFDFLIIIALVKIGEKKRYNESDLRKAIIYSTMIFLYQKCHIIISRSYKC